MDASLSVTEAPSEPEWVQLYIGIARGLGNLSVNVTECAEDGNITVATFRAAFDAFEDRRIYDGKISDTLSLVNNYMYMYLYTYMHVHVYIHTVYVLI